MSENPNILLNADSKPFSSKPEAEAYAKEHKLGGDFRVDKFGEGFAIFNLVALLAMANPAGPQSVASANKFSGKCKRVVFQQRSDSNATDDVKLVLNGDTLPLQRGREVILPVEFLQGPAHDARYKTWHYEPGGDRLVEGDTIEKYPFQEKGEATWEEYLKFKREGTAARDRWIAQNVRT